MRFFNVGQGDAELVTYSNFSMLIDCGDGSKDVSRMVRSYGVDKLDFLVLSHADADHVGGCAKVLREIPTANVIDSGAPKDTTAYRNFEVESTRSQRIIVTEDRNIYDGIHIFTAIDENSGYFTDSNSNTLLLMFSYGDKKFLFAGDCSANCETRISKDIPDVDLLKVAHHGSATSSTTQFLEKAKPEISIISVGENNYGHPTIAAILRLREYSKELYRTDIDGTITIISDGRRTIDKV